jgi:hypothetical protein
VSYRQPGIINSAPELLILAAPYYMDRTSAQVPRVDVVRTFPAGSLVTWALTGPPRAR